MHDDHERRTAALFDIDGTLVDSNYLHVEAWDRAFAAVGHPVEVWRIHRAIGMDSAALLDELLGADAAALGDAAKAEHSAVYGGFSDRLRPFEGARELLAELDHRGVRVVLATSAPEDELETLLEVLGVDDTVDVVTSGQDVTHAKPAPDIVAVALERAGVAAECAVMIGDSVWDVEAAARVGVRSVGVLSGGTGRAELLDAGAVEVYDDIAALLRGLDASVLTAASVDEAPESGSVDASRHRPRG